MPPKCKPAKLAITLSKCCQQMLSFVSPRLRGGQLISYQLQWWVRSSQDPLPILRCQPLICLACGASHSVHMHLVRKARVIMTEMFSVSRESGTCYSVHHSASADASSRQQAVLDALSDAAEGASCTHIASHFAAGLKANDESSLALTHTDSLMQVGLNCFARQWVCSVQACCTRICV